jgi:hypothetical protein
MGVEHLKPFYALQSNNMTSSLIIIEYALDQSHSPHPLKNNIRTIYPRTERVHMNVTRLKLRMGAANYRTVFR